MILGRFYLLLNADVFSEETKRCVTAENTGEIALAVVVCQLLYTEVGGNNRGAAVDEPLIDTQAEP